MHCFLDGRDTPPTSGKDYVIELEEKMKELGVGEVGVFLGSLRQDGYARKGKKGNKEYLFHINITGLRLCRRR